jgi:hypothetical protein
MSNLFHINPIRKVDNPDKIQAIENSLDRDKKSQKQEFQESLDELENKINMLVKKHHPINDDLKSNLDLQTKMQALELATIAASSFLRKELLTVAKSILALSLEEDLTEDEIDPSLSFSDYLAKLIMKRSVAKKISSDNVKSKVGKSNPNEDRNAGYLAHYSHDILKNKPQFENNSFKSEKINKKDIKKYLKK